MSKALLETLTPVHIGSGKSYKHKIEFFSEGKYIYIIDPEKIFQKIGIEGINEWVKAIDKNVPVKDFLSNRKLFFKPEEIALRKCKLFNEIKRDKELHEQIYNPLLGPYIPGSSIKGAIKTAILSYISNNEQIINKINLKHIKTINEKNQIEWNDKKTDEILFGEDANHKSTRFIKIGDAHFGNIETIVYFAQALNADVKSWKLNGKISNLYEAIPEGAKTLFEFKFDNLLFKRNFEKENEKWIEPQFEFLPKDITSLIKLFNEETKNALNKEIEFFNDLNLDNAGNNLIKKYDELLKKAINCRDNEFIIRVGANSGYNFTTLRWVDKLPFFHPLKNNYEYALLRKEIQKNRNKKDYRAEQLWPPDFVAKNG